MGLRRDDDQLERSPVEPDEAGLNLYSLVPARSWITAVFAVAAGLAGGACGAALIAVINTALNDTRWPRGWLATAFLALVVSRAAANAAARLFLNRFTQDTLSHLNQDLARRVLATPLWQLERVGIARILATLTHDVSMLGWAAQNLPSVAVNLAVILGCAIYLGWLSWPSLVALACVIAAGSVVHRLLIRRAYRYLQRARDTRDRLFQHFRALTEGTKELKLHAARREAFLAKRIAPASDALRHDSIAGVKHHIVADTWSQLLFYGLIGGLLFAAPTLQTMGAKTLTGYVLVMLYVMNPVWSVMEVWSIFAQARVSLQKVRELGLSLETANDTTRSVDQGSVEGDGWERLEFEGVTFAYPADSEGRAFVLGPLDFTLKRGELVFLVGGNGSGKSTFMKVLTGLYMPQTGQIRLDDAPIADDNREWYCRHFSAVFTDFYLFDTLLGLESPDLDQRAGHYLAQLELDTKVSISDGALSTTALSQGQRKRLALLTSFVEDRAIYIFDEWAADQDPHYRQIFYERLLPELKSRGKTIVVISHDDRYYHLGDRLVKLDYGKLVREQG